MPLEAIGAEHGLHVLDDDLHVAVAASHRPPAYGAGCLVACRQRCGRTIRHGPPFGLPAPAPGVKGCRAQAEAEPTWGLEPQTCALRKRCSTTELSGRYQSNATYATRGPPSKASSTGSQAAALVVLAGGGLLRPVRDSAIRVAARRLIAMIECCGFTPRLVGKTLESSTYSPAASCV